MNKQQFQEFILNGYKKCYDNNNDGPHCIDFNFRMDGANYAVEWWHRAPAEYKQEFLMLQKMYPEEYYLQPEYSEYVAHIFAYDLDMRGTDHIDTIQADNFVELIKEFFNIYGKYMEVI